jgi:hypothetical protein
VADTVAQDVAFDAWLGNQCERLRGHVLARHLAPPAEVEQATPGGDATLEEWVRWYGQLRAWVWHQDETPGERQEAEERLLDALHGKPRQVRLTDGTTVQVYPKGMEALLWFRARDMMLAWLDDRLQLLHEAARTGQLERTEIPNPSDVLEAATEEMTRQLALLCHMACTPGPALPADADADPPQRYRDLHVWDLHFINRAFWNVNAAPLADLARIVGKSKGGSERMSWNVFQGTLAMRLRVAPEELAQKRSLISLLAQVRLAQPNLGDEIED